MRDAVQKTVERFGRLDVMFNNAGFNRPLPFMDVDEDNFNSIMRVNAYGVLVGTQEAARQMMAQGGGGKIINTASIAGRQGYAEFAPYCASKASVISLTQAGAREFAKPKSPSTRLRRVLWLRRFGMASSRTCSTKALSRRRANSSSRSHPASCWAFRRSPRIWAGSRLFSPPRTPTI